MKIVLDTNIIVSDFWMQGSNFRILIETSSDKKDQIFVPKIVVDEVLNKFRQRLEAGQNKINNEVEKLRRLTYKSIDISVTNENIQKLYNDYIGHLTKTLDDSNFIILEYPKTPHEKLANKAIQKTKPFKENGDGYRDNLIWESIKELLTTDEEKLILPEIIFITKNTSDFADSNGLHEQLKEELEEEGYDEDSVILYDGLSRYVDERAKTELQFSQQLTKKLISDQFDSFSLKKEVDNWLFANLIGKRFDAEELGIKREFEEPTIDSINEDFEFQEISVKRLSDDEIVIDIKFEMVVYLAVFVYHSDYWSIDDEEGLYIIDDNWNDHVMLGQLVKYLTFDISIVATNEMEIKSMQIVKINDNYV